MMDYIRIEESISLARQLSNESRIYGKPRLMLNEIQRLLSTMKILTDNDIDAASWKPLEMFWPSAIEFSAQFVSSLAEEHGAHAGCLPESDQDCKLYSEVMRLKELITADYFLCKPQRKNN